MKAPEPCFNSMGQLLTRAQGTGFDRVFTCSINCRESGMPEEWFS